MSNGQELFESAEYIQWTQDYDGASNAQLDNAQLDDDNQRREEDMVDRSKAFEGEGGKWLKASDLEGKGVAKVKIAAVLDEVMEDFTTKKPVDKVCLMFEGREKGLVLNKTNGDALISEYGGDDAAWVGKEVGLEYYYYEDFGKAGIVLSLVDREFNDDIPF